MLGGVDHFYGKHPLQNEENHYLVVANSDSE